MGRSHDPGLTNQSSTSPWPVIGSGKGTCDFNGSNHPWVAKVTGAAAGENAANAEESGDENVREKQNLDVTGEEP